MPTLRAFERTNPVHPLCASSWILRRVGRARNESNEEYAFEKPATKIVFSYVAP